MIRNPDDTSEAQTQCTAPQWGRRFRQLRLLPPFAHAMHGYNSERWEGEWSVQVCIQGIAAECDRDCVLDCGCNLPRANTKGRPSKARHDKLGMLQRLKGSFWMVALEKTAVNLPEINEERFEARARARLGAPQQSQVCLDSNRRPTVVIKQLPLCRWTGRSAGRCPIGCGPRTLSSPQPLVVVVLCLDVSTRFGMGRLLLWAEACCRASAALDVRNSKKMASVRWCFGDALRGRSAVNGLKAQMILGAVVGCGRAWGASAF